MSYQISIIIPVYNQEDYLKECLDSVVNQTIGIENIEVILIDDKSTDKSSIILNEYADKYSSFKIVNHDVNKGLGEAKNTGMKHVSSDYVMFLDSDDFISLDIIEKSLKQIKENKCDLLIYNWVKFPKDEFVLHKPHITENKFIKSISEKPNLIFATSSCAKIFHKSLYSFLKFPKIFYEDNISTLESIFNAKKIFLTTEIGYYYRKNDNSITKKINIRNPLDLALVIKNLFNLVKQYPENQKYIKSLIIKFIDDILFWLNEYDWYYLEELEIVKTLQNAVLESILEQDIDFYYTISSQKLLYSDAMLNLNKYDVDGFLAKYKYFLNLPKINPIANLYVDNGNGFSEENKVSLNYNLKNINNLTFDLTKFDNIQSLRFDPLEGDFIRCKILNTNPITNRTSVNSNNSLLDEYQTFFTLDPSYILDGDFKNIEKINIQFELNILNNKELSEILLNQNVVKDISKENTESKSFLKKFLR